MIEDQAESYTSFMIRMLDLSDGTADRAISIYDELVDDIEARMLALEGGGVSAVRRYERLNALMEQSRAQIRFWAAEQKGEVEQVLRDLITAGGFDDAGVLGPAVQNAVDGIEAGLGVTRSVLSVAIPPSIVDSLIDGVRIANSDLASSWAKYVEDLDGKVERAIRLGVLSGESMDEIVRRVAPAWEGGRRNLRAIVRTGVMGVSNSARAEVIRQNQDVVKGVQLLTALDNRVSLICMGRSLLFYRLTPAGYEPVGHDKPYLSGPPYHYNCRTTTVVVTRDFNELPGSVKAAIPKRMQFGNGKLLPADWDYEKVLTTLPVGEQIKRLGPGRYRLWKDEGFPLSELISSSGKPRTINELRRLRG